MQIIFHLDESLWEFLHLCNTANLGMLFDGGGRCVEVPGQDMVPPAACIKSYPLAERDGWVWVWISQNDAKPVSAIPSLPYFDNAYQHSWDL